MQINKLVALCICVWWSVSLYAQPSRIQTVENNLTETKTLIFEDSMQHRYNIGERMKYYHIPSVSIAVIQHGKIAWVKAYGYADVEMGSKANTNTLYQVASITKSVNGFGVMRLVQSGKLSLDRDIRGYLKTWTFPDNEKSAGKDITLKQLLSHTAGLSVHGFIGYRTSDSIPTVNQVLNGTRPANNEAVKPIYAPGERFNYSGGGTTVIRKILDDNISTNYDSLMRSLVLAPLHMDHSTYGQPLDPSYKNFAHAYELDMQPVKGNFYIYPEQAASGLWSTATDIAMFVLGVQKSIHTGGLLDSNTARQMLTAVQGDYALGFGIEEKGGEKYFRHEGQSYGFSAMYYGSFTTGNGVVILTNAYPDNGHPFIEELLNSVATAYDWKDFYNPVKKKLVAIPDSILDRYTGEYISETPAMKITISRKNSFLELAGRRTERMYPTGNNKFFLASSPDDDCIFSSSRGDGIMDLFEVKQGGKTIITATRRSIVTASVQTQDNYIYKPKSEALYKTIIRLDSIYFNAYNGCDMDKQAAMYADSIEFYHDGGGLETSKQKLLSAIKENICGKVTRVLVKGSIEVYEIPGYGAVEIALHRFINHRENDALSKPDRFIIVWKHINNEWQITRVISLHMGN